ncbi:MAG: carbamate kinase [Chloroflexota bacterium]
MGKKIVVALGGNAILQPGQFGTSDEQRHNVDVTAEAIAELIRRGHQVVVTHGNGPQVGNILIQNEEASGLVPAMPLDICGAESQGQIGYMIQQSLHNRLHALGIDKPVVTVVTQVVVDPHDPAFADPTKPVGPFYSKEKAAELKEAKGWVMKEAGPKGWRRVVPSPQPKAIFERDSVRALIGSGAVVIASGGGGIPVKDENGVLSGVEAVIDKDLAGERLAHDVGADIFIILTDVEQAALNFGQPEQRNLSRMTLAEVEQYAREGHFKAGSMGPKVEAARRFVAAGGEKAIITSLHKAVAALEGLAGTAVVR